MKRRRHAVARGVATKVGAVALPATPMTRCRRSAPSVTARQLPSAAALSGTTSDRVSAPCATTSEGSLGHTCGAPEKGETTFFDPRRTGVTRLTRLPSAQTALVGCGPSDPSSPRIGSSTRPLRSGTALPAPKRLV